MIASKQPDVRKEALLALFVFVAFMAIGAATAGRPGLSWDESSDLQSAANVVLWIKAIPGRPVSKSFSRDELLKGWGNDWKHGPASRTIHAAAWFVSSGFSQDKWFRNVTAFRLGTAAAFAVLGAMAAFAGMRLGGFSAGLLSAVLLLCIPRTFAHSHHCATDVISAALFFAAAMSAWKAAQDTRVIPSAVFGAILSASALAKETGAILFPLFVAMVVLSRTPGWWKKLIVAAAAAVIFYFAFQPLYWAAPATAAKRYFGYLLHGGGGVSVWTYYFAQRYEHSTPWHYPFVMLGITTPLLTIALFIAGCAGALKERRGVLLWMLACCAAVPLFFALPAVPSFDAERLLLPCSGFIAVIGGLGGLKIAGLLKSPLYRSAAVLIFAATSCFTLFRAVPMEHLYFNEMIGGVAGAVRHGMDVDYWGSTVDVRFVEEMNKTLPRGAKLTALGYNSGNLEYYQALGKLRRDIVIVGYNEPSDAALLCYRPGVFDRHAWLLFQRSRPVTAVLYKGVLITGLYRNRPM